MSNTRTTTYLSKIGLNTACATYETVFGLDQLHSSLAINSFNCRFAFLTVIKTLRTNAKHFAS